MAYNIQVMETLPPGTSIVSAKPAANCTQTDANCVISKLAAGASFTLNIELSVDADVAADTELINSVRVISDAFDSQTSNNAASATAKVSAMEQLHVIKSGPAGPILAGNLLDYSILVENVGLSMVRAVEIEDNLPEQVEFVSYQLTHPGGVCIERSTDPEVVCRLGDMDPGEKQIIVIRVRVKPETDNGHIENVLVHQDRFTTNSVERVQTRIKSDQHAFRIEQSASVDSVSPGDVFSYEVKATNIGPSTINNVRVTVILPSVLSYVSDTLGCGPALTDCAIGALQPGEMRSFQILVQLDPDITSFMQVVSTVRASADTPDGIVTTEQSSIVIANGETTTNRPLFLPMITQ
jgi:uncharacterized repeat protein (TIGR01451 family)